MMAISASLSDPMPPVAIIGLAALMPKAVSAGAFWANIVNGLDCIEEVPASRWSCEDYFSEDPAARDKTYCRRGGFIPDIAFDPLAYGLPPHVLATTDCAQLFALAVAKAAFADAGYPVLCGTDHSRTAAILGVAGTTMKLWGKLAVRLQSPVWKQSLAAAGIEDAVAATIVENILSAYPEWDENAFPGVLANVVTGRIANRFDLGAANYVVDAACASSLCAIRLACMELAAGACDIALTGGVDTDNSITAFLSFSKTPALSRTQQVRPFDAKADGTLIAEGLGMLVLKRLDDALTAGDRIYAVIRGIGVSSDGRGNAIYVPRTGGQVQAIEAALAQADIDPATVGLIEAHGTGTPVGDEAEIESLMQVYGPSHHAAAPVALGSVKSQIGHTKAAAGAASMIKVALALHHHVVPPTSGIGEPNALIARDDSPFTLPRAARPWFSPDGAPRRAAVSAFGFGGANYHAILEEYRPAEAMQAAGQMQHDRRERRPQPANVTGELVAVFSGQGSQYVGMGASLAIDYPPFRAAVELIDRTLSEVGDAPCSAVMFPPWPRTAAEGERQRAQLRQTLYAQAAVGAFSMGAYRLLEAAGLQPACAIGHSFGELTALWSAGCFTDDEFARLVVARGRSLSPPAGVDAGGLLAIRAPQARAEAIIRKVPGLRIANLNAPEQTVVGGPLAAIAEGEHVCAAEGVEAIRLQVAAAFHTPCIEYARAPWRDAVAGLHPAPPQHMVIANADAAPYPSDPQEIARILAEQPFRAVRFREQVEAAYRNGGRIFLEIGPRAVIAGLIDEILKDRPHQTIAINPASAAHASSQLAMAIERLKAAGIALEPLPPAQSAVPAEDAGMIAAPHGPATIRLSASGVVREGTAASAPLRTPPASPAPAPASVPTPRNPRPAAMAAAVRPAIAPFAHPSPEGGLAPMATQDLRHLQSLTAQAHGLFLSGQGAIARALLDPATASDPAAMALLRDVQESGAALHEHYLQDQGDIVRSLVGGAGRPRAASPAASPLETSTAPEPPPPAPLAAAEPAQAEPQALAPQATARPPGDLLLRLREAVASATGYPLDFITARMDLEADLGIDSVKRMEILAGFRSPDLAVPARELGRCRSLEDIVRLLDAAAPQAKPASQPPAAGAEPAERDVAGALLDMDGLLRQIVSEQTGYPADALLPTMNLEADLGIDSIKRAEILAAAAARCGIAGGSYPKAARGSVTLAELAALLRAACKPMPSESAPHSTAPTIAYAVLRPADRRTQAPVGISHALVAGGGSALTQAVQDALHSRGIPSSKLLAGEMAQGDLAYRLNAIIKESGPVRAVLLLAPPRSTPADQRFVQTEAFIHWLQAILPLLPTEPHASAPARVLAATRLDGRFGHSGLAAEACEESGIRAAIKTARYEWPHLLLQAIDIDAQLAPAEAAQALTDELLAAEFGVDDTAVDAGGRYRLDFEPATPAVRSHVPLQRDDLVLFSGGGRGIGGLCAEALASKTGARLLLLGRTAFMPEDPDWAALAQGRALRTNAAKFLRDTAADSSLRAIERTCRTVEASREVRATLERLRRHTEFAEYLCADVSDEAALGAALREASVRLGPVTALVHAAGVLADRRIEDIREGDVEQVFAPKVLGLRHLLRSLGSHSLSRIALFSSTAASFGNEGQAVYAMANEVLNTEAFAIARQMPGARVVAIDWGPWRGGMVSDDLAARFAKKGIGLLTPEAGTAAFLDLFLAEGAGAFQFAAGDIPPAAARPLAQELPVQQTLRESA